MNSNRYNPYNNPQMAEEVKKLIDGNEELSSISQISHSNICETASISFSLNTPAFSACKNFTFKDLDSLDHEISERINQIFIKFYTYDNENAALTLLEDLSFRAKFPHINESLKKVIISTAAYRKNSKTEKMAKIQQEIDKNSKKIINDENLNLYVGKALALQELRLNLDFLNRKPKEKEKLASCTQTADCTYYDENHNKRVSVLEGQLENLTGIIKSMQNEKMIIERFQDQLIKEINRKKNQETQESFTFFKERYESTNKLFLNLQDSHKKTESLNKILIKKLEKTQGCKFYIDQSSLMDKANEARYQLSALIKSIEESRPNMTQDLISIYISHLHEICMKLIIREFETYKNEESLDSTEEIIRNPYDHKTPKPLVNTRSKSSLKSPSEKLDVYLMNY
ncbi:hypothetical protein SteCoe_8953 [Stentor coeruleus]|uniref:Uncharacterized protein n=1 Tax=Stentor coeruleus TaxID=5963 RepID=A0A1R2CIW7_9CILI|nr:hypothetical protein SteCoe_8953 [Stentor coeruleus]